MHTVSGRKGLIFFTTFTLFLAAVAFTATGQAAGQPAPISGTIASIDGSVVTLTLADSTTEMIDLQPNTLILERTVVTFDQIQAGDGLGVAARRDNGKLVATSINVFAPAMWDGARKGQFDMNDGQVMTNAMVDQIVTDVSGNVLTMKYADGMATITVPEGAQIHKLLSLKPADLVVGLHISVRGKPNSDGSVTASSVSFDQPAKG